jgi:hypothetical protein
LILTLATSSLIKVSLQTVPIGRCFRYFLQ